MNAGINLTAIYIANIMGLLTAVITLCGNWMMLSGSSSDGKIFKHMLLTVGISCIVDPLVFFLDGRPGLFPYLVVYAGNFWLYFSNLLIGPLWVLLVSRHAFGGLLKLEKILLALLCGMGLAVLLVNFFVPVVFGMDSGNHYVRGPAFSFYTVLEAIFLLTGISAYYYAKIKGGIFKFFPVWLFIVPAVLGVAIQAVFYGTSTIWPCIAISINGILSGLRNEVTYRDSLTGLYNRYYLNNIREKISRGKYGNITAMMLDLNDFKSVNDIYGHQEGDVALQTVADALRSSVGAMGSVIRYAGDEFVVLLNTQSEELVQSCMDAMRAALEKKNDSGMKPYRLSFSIGSSGLDVESQTLDDLINVVDRKMYEDKEKYHAQHDRGKASAR